MSLARWACLVALAPCCGCAPRRPIDFINIAFTPSVDTDDYETWSFELESCQDLDDGRVDNERIRTALLAAIREEFERLGHPYVDAVDSPDFLIYYELEITEDPDLRADERFRGRIFVRDAKTRRLVWRGERKAPVTGEPMTPEEQSVAVRRFVQTLLYYTLKLQEPDEQR